MSDYQHLQEEKTPEVTPGEPEDPPSPSDAESGSTQKKPHPIHVPFNGIRIKGFNNFRCCFIISLISIMIICGTLGVAHLSFLHVDKYCICLPEPGFHLRVHGNIDKAKCQYINKTTGEVDHEYRYSGFVYKQGWEDRNPPIDKQCRKEKSLRLMYMLTFPTLFCFFILIVALIGGCCTFDYNNYDDNASSEEIDAMQVEILWPFLISFLFLTTGLILSPILIVVAPIVFVGWNLYIIGKWVKEYWSCDICNNCFGGEPRVVDGAEDEL